MLKPLLWTFMLLAGLGLTLPAAAQEADVNQQTQIENFLRSLKFQSGKISLPGGIAELNLPNDFRYLDPNDTGRLLSEGWGNPPGVKTLGMILPASVNPLGGQGWGVIITYSEDGHVNDADAESIDYAALLKDMQENQQQANQQRKEQNLSTLTLTGWAENPTYDQASRKLYWAMDLLVDDLGKHSLNYNIRILGRQGVLVLTAVAGMEQLEAIKAEMPAVLAFTNFTSGNAYADFNESTDKVAAYGLAALVAGGAAAKLGLFAKLFAVAVAFKKVIILGVIGAGMAIRRIFGRGKTDKTIT